MINPNPTNISSLPTDGVYYLDVRPGDDTLVWFFGRPNSMLFRKVGSNATVHACILWHVKESDCLEDGDRRITRVEAATLLGLTNNEPLTDTEIMSAPGTRYYRNGNRWIVCSNLSPRVYIHVHVLGSSTKVVTRKSIAFGFGPEYQRVASVSARTALGLPQESGNPATAPQQRQQPASGIDKAVVVVNVDDVVAKVFDTLGQPKDSAFGKLVGKAVADALLDTALLGVKERKLTREQMLALGLSKKGRAAQYQKQHGCASKATPAPAATPKPYVPVPGDKVLIKSATDIADALVYTSVYRPLRTAAIGEIATVKEYDPSDNTVLLEIDGRLWFNVSDVELHGDF